MTDATNPLFLEDYLYGAHLAALLFFVLFPLLVIPSVAYTVATSEGSRRWIVGALGLTMVVLLVLQYRAWFGSTFYRIENLATGTSVRLGLVLPERTLDLSAEQIKTIRRTTGPRGLGSVVVIETRSGRDIVSPSLSRAEAEIIEAIARSTEINRLHGESPGNDEDSRR